MEGKTQQECDSDELSANHDSFHFTLQQYLPEDPRMLYLQEFQGNPYPPSFYSYFDIPIEVKQVKKKETSLRKGKWTVRNSFVLYNNSNKRNCSLKKKNSQIR
jgi:hypothetical protein